MTEYEYVAKKGGVLNDEQAKLFGKRMDFLIDKYGGQVTTEQILADAKNKKSPIHDLYDWDKESICDKYWLHQTRLFKGSIIRVIIRVDNTKSRMPAYYNVKLEKKEKDEIKPYRAYVKYDRVVSEKPLLNQICEKLMAEMRYVQRLLQDFMEQ